MADDDPIRRVDPEDFATRVGLAAGGRVFGRYTLEAVAGRGGMGIVWRARDNELGEVVALKFLPEVVALDPAAVDELRQETRRARRLTHANIVRIHDFVRDDAMAAVSMEYVDGRTMTHLRMEQPGKVFAADALAPLVAQLCAALEYAHQDAKIVHRDLKPANLLVTRDGRLKVTDFGIARSLSESHTRITGHAGATSGTLPYMSPQQLAGDRPMATDDIYALGATLYELLTGKPPFFRGDAYSLMTQIKERTPDPLDERRAELAAENEVTEPLPPIPDAWQETILACLAKKPEDRSQSAAEVARRLNLTADVREPLRRSRTDDEQTGGTADSADGADKRKAGRAARRAERERARQNIDDAATRRAERQPAVPNEDDAERGLKHRATDAAGRSAELQPALPRQHAKRKSRPLLVAVVIALALGVLAYAFWPRSTAAPAGATNDSATAGGHERQPLDGFDKLTAGRLGALSSSNGRVDSVAASAKRADAALTAGFAVTVDPPDVGARLWLGPLSDIEVKDGKAQLKGLPDGEQELTVQAPGYQPFTTRVTVKDGRGNFEARLVPVRGEVSVTARPGTEVIAVDERGRETRVGSVPAGGVLDVANLLTVGRYTLKLEHADCAPVTVPGVELVIGRTVKVAPEQAPLPAELRVFSVPTGAEVRVNGTVAGSTPATIKKQPSEQALRIEVFQHGYRRVDQSVTLKPKEARTLNVGTLVAEAGGIALRMTDSQFSIAAVGLRIDGKPIEVARVGANEPFVLEGLEVGSRTVEITHPDYEPWRQVVNVRDQETTAVNVELKPKPGTVDFGSVPQGARVFINGGDLHEAVFSDNATKVENLTPFRGALPPGTYMLRFELKGYKSATCTATVAANRTAGVSAALEKQTYPEPGQAWENTLGMKFAPVLGTGVLFCIWDTRVQDFEAFVKETSYDATGGMYSIGNDGWQQRGDSWRSPGFPQGPTHPVCGVNWDDAKAFCQWLTEKERREGRLAANQEYRLPTDAEWSVAAGLNEQSGGTPQSKDGRIPGVYPWGTQWPPPRGAGNFAGTEVRDGNWPSNWSVIEGYNDGYPRTSPVGSFGANRYGLYDMTGNVWLWCEDFYNGSNGSRVLRGGSFINLGSDTLLSSYRGSDAPGDRYGIYGFRCVLVVSAP